MQEVIGRSRPRSAHPASRGQPDGRGTRRHRRPADDLVFEVWLHKAAMEAVIAHYQSIADRMSALSDEVAQLFVAFDRDVGFQSRWPHRPRRSPGST